MNDCIYIFKSYRIIQIVPIVAIAIGIGIGIASFRFFLPVSNKQTGVKQKINGLFRYIIRFNGPGRYG